MLPRRPRRIRPRLMLLQEREQDRYGVCLVLHHLHSTHSRRPVFLVGGIRTLRPFKTTTSFSDNAAHTSRLDRVSIRAEPSPTLDRKLLQTVIFDNPKCRPRVQWSVSLMYQGFFKIRGAKSFIFRRCPTRVITFLKNHESPGKLAGNHIPVSRLHCFTAA